MNPKSEKIGKGMTPVEERRARLLWFLEARRSNPMTTSDIAERATVVDYFERYVHIYSGNGRYDRCNRDLKSLSKSGKVTGWGRPKRWVAV